MFNATNDKIKVQSSPIINSLSTIKVLVLKNVDKSCLLSICVHQ